MKSIPPAAGTLLIAEPFLGDTNFDRSVVCLCQHSEQGSFGLILNQPLPFMLHQVIDDILPDNFPLFSGGPVERNTLHFLHRFGKQIPKSVEIAEGLFWSGDFETIRSFLNTGLLQPTDIKFFVGYSGWSGGQLADELSQPSWILSEADASIIFDTPSTKLWQKVLSGLGGHYEALASYPASPPLN